MKQKYIGGLFLIFLFVGQIYAGNHPFSLEEKVAGKYTPQMFSAVQPLFDGEYYSVLSADGKSILKYAYKDGKLVDTLFHVEKVKGNSLKSIEGYLVNASETRILVWHEKEQISLHSWKATVYDYQVQNKILKPLSDQMGKLSSPLFSPDGRMVSFIRDNNIWLKKLDYDTESPVTKDGEKDKILNGTTGWVYQEGFEQPYLISWSSDSQMLAFLKTDESDLSTDAFPVYENLLYPDVRLYKYPKAGKKNPKVACYVFDISTKNTRKMKIPLDEDGYIPEIRFTENPNQLAVMTLNRHQNRLSIYMVNPKLTMAQLVLQDENSYYIQPRWIHSVLFSNKHFLYVCEKSGFAHIYLYSMTGVMEKQLTSGAWDVTKIYGFNEETQTVYYQSAEESPLRRAIYKTDLKGHKVLLSSDKGWNDAVFSKNNRYFIHSFSNVITPTRVSIKDERGKDRALLEDNKIICPVLSEIDIPQKEFFSFLNKEGDRLNGWMIKPSHFQSDKRYPVLLIPVNVPGSQAVCDEYSLDWYYDFARQGYLIVSVDGRGTGARGEVFQKCNYLQMGLKESDDQIEAANYLGKLEYVDRNLMAICGWEYGGLIALMSMSRSDLFYAGIAIAPITDWQYCYSVYSERFMRTPQENMKNYRLCSPVTIANQLHGNLLLVHETDNEKIQIQHTFLYSKALIEAGNMFDMQIYPSDPYGISSSVFRLHLYKRIILFLNQSSNKKTIIRENHHGYESD